VDVFSHLFWTMLAFHGERPFWLWALLGTLPDILTWGPWTVPLIARRRWNEFDLNRVPGWVMGLYGATHNLFTPLALWGAAFAATGQVVTAPLAWLLHVLMDAPTHSRHFLPTPILWPVSDWRFPGVRWGQRWFMAGNIAAMAALMLYLFAIEGVRLKWA
jgi:hypothetical protein